MSSHMVIHVCACGLYTLIIPFYFLLYLPPLFLFLNYMKSMVNLHKSCNEGVDASDDLLLSTPPFSPINPQISTHMYMFQLFVLRFFVIIITRTTMTCEGSFLHPTSSSFLPPDPAHHQAWEADEGKHQYSKGDGEKHHHQPNGGGETAAHDPKGERRGKQHHPKGGGRTAAPLRRRSDIRTGFLSKVPQQGHVNPQHMKTSFRFVRRFLAGIRIKI